MPVESLRLCVALTLCLCPLAHAAVTVSIRAVAKNGIPVAPTSTLNVQPGDIVAADLYLYGWGTPPFDGASGMLQSFQITLAGMAGAVSAGACQGTLEKMILPRGWDAPIEKDHCPCDDPEFPICHGVYGCVGPNHHPEQVASAGAGGRTDFIFHGRPSTCSLDVSSLDIRWSCTLNASGGQSAFKCQGGKNAGGSCTTNIHCPGGMCNSQFSHYAGTLYLKVGADACGSSTYTLLADITRTFVISSAHPNAKVLPFLQGLTLTSSDLCPWEGGACCTDDPAAPNCAIVACPEYCVGANQRFSAATTCATIEPPCLCETFSFDTDPPHCFIDARAPLAFGSAAAAAGIQSINSQFTQVCPENHEIEDYVVTQIPDTGPLPPSIERIELTNQMATIHFSGPINPNCWTCVRHVPINKRVCIGYLPGDVDGNRFVSPVDILEMVDHLNGLLSPPLDIHQCDIDRSGACAPGDILAEVDLLNGVSGLPAQNGRTLPDCPSANP